MSGDVQPRKRKDKKRKKDELGVEEPRGTAAVLGEGDVFIHSYHEHGTGGHWCAKIIFFSLLAVLVTLIGLIILENRGLTELEANSVETRYSGVLDGWLEDTPDDDHHDEHTLELLKHHDADDDLEQEQDNSQEDQDESTANHDENQNDDDDDDDDDEEDDQDRDSNYHEASNEEQEEDKVNDQDSYNDEETDDDDEHDKNDDDEDDNDDENEGEDEEHIDINKSQPDDENSDEQQLEDADEDDDETPFNNNESDEDNNDDDIQKVDENDTEEEDDDDNLQNYQVDDESLETDYDRNSREDDEEQEENDDDQTDASIEVEKLEKEVSDQDTLSEEQPAQETEENDKSQEISSELPLEDNLYATDEIENYENEEYQEDDIDEPLPVVERIVVPKGKPLPEVEEEPSIPKPADTLADEEEYEKQQEELRREEAEASHVWLKLAVGGALLVATHAVVSRAVAPRDETPASEDHAIREDTPLIDRRMTLVTEEVPSYANPREVMDEIVSPILDFEKSSQIKFDIPPSKEESEDEEEEEEEIIDKKNIIKEAPSTAVDLETRNKELFSDDEDADEIEEEEEVIEQKKETPKQAPPITEKVIEPKPEEEEIEEDVPDDVEIIDDEHLEEELGEEEDDEEEISDVDDAELLTRLEAKYGRLPEPERGQKHKDGGNSIEDDWPGEPSDKYWRQQLDEAEQELRQGAWSAALSRAVAAPLRDSARARWLVARALDAQAEAQRDNRLLSRAIAAYLDLLKLNDRLTDDRLRQIATRTLDRIRFRGTYLSAEPVYRLLIRRFPDVVDYRNNLTVAFLMANRADLAEEVIKETLRTWPDDRVALAHLGFILKTQHNRLEEAVEALQKALEGDVGPATESRFYYHLGDSLLLLNRFAEAHEVHKRAAKLGHFLSPAQRSLYNVNRLKSRPWWEIEQTPYLKLARALENSWKDILKEGQAAQTLYEKEKEGLKERGEWSQLDLFVRGQEVPGRCKKAPVTCSIVRAEKAAAGCRRGQIKFSAMEAGTHVRPHVGPTNCRLRMHLGLSNTKDTYIRVDQEIRQWQVGKVFMFDDSFEHEVWHNGTGTRLVLIVDVWHPDLSPDELRSLPAI